MSLTGHRRGSARVCFRSMLTRSAVLTSHHSRAPRDDEGQRFGPYRGVFNRLAARPSDPTHLDTQLFGLIYSLPTNPVSCEPRLMPSCTQCTTNRGGSVVRHAPMDAPGLHGICRLHGEDSRVGIPHPTGARRGSEEGSAVRLGGDQRRHCWWRWMDGLQGCGAESQLLGQGRLTGEDSSSSRANLTWFAEPHRSQVWGFIFGTVIRRRLRG